MFFDDVEKYELLSYKSGDIVVAQGDSTNYVYYLLEGICTRTRFRENGNEFIFGIRKSSSDISSILGLLILLNNRTEYTCNFIAITDCKCCKIPKQKFMERLEWDTDLLRRVIKFSVAEYDHLLSIVVAHSENSIANFVCQILYELSEVNNSGERTVSNKYTNEVLAKMCGVTSVTIARIMSYLKNEDIILRDRRGLTIKDEPKMLEYCYGKLMKYKQ